MTRRTEMGPRAAHRLRLVPIVDLVSRALGFPVSLAAPLGIPMTFAAAPSGWYACRRSSASL